jgi:hypothetical protein
LWKKVLVVSLPQDFSENGFRKATSGEANDEAGEEAAQNLPMDDAGLFQIDNCTARKLLHGLKIEVPEHW